MAFEFERLISASAPDVWHAILHRAAFWQESQVPEVLKKSGILGVSARRNGDHFTLECEAYGN
jgi:hypothetical protein